MISCEHIDCRREDEVLIISLNRADKKNAITGDMYRAMTSALETAASDDSIHVLLITAAGNFFCAGNDVHGFKAIADIPYQQRPGFNFMKTLARFGKPVVAAVPGDAVGIGATMLLHCDLVYLTENSQLKLPFVSIGLVPEFASTTLLTQRLGYQRAAELLMLRQHLDATEALALGLVNKVLPAEQLFDVAMQSCNALSQQPNAALQQTKRLMKQPELPAIIDKIEQETLAINQLLANIKLPTKQ
ncbi:enoyl-CoA hydratase-related protein [Dasania marina]|uniref:enoyl-CoA hydratase-related protein n=1 Tax=Dasania marina TaxID=471499 RepID=UPI00035D78BE|nr:enoyl-CoA hydratase-related protein [Dasania marina]